MAWPWSPSFSPRCSPPRTWPRAPPPSWRSVSPHLLGADPRFHRSSAIKSVDVESLPAAGTVRRTVRVAVALVVGQALLVGLIGWLTLGRATGSGGAVDQMAAAPATPPP